MSVVGELYNGLVGCDKISTVTVSNHTTPKQLTAPPNQPPTTEFIGRHKYDFNSPSRLPPVGCKLVIKVGDSEMIAERTGYIADRDDMMEYKLHPTNEIIMGRFDWIYY